MSKKRKSSYKSKSSHGDKLDNQLKHYLRKTTTKGKATNKGENE